MERNFPDKKQSQLDYNAITQHIEEGQRLSKEMKVGQETATWVTHGEYLDLPIAVVLISDEHFGSTGTDYKLLDKHLKIIEETPNFFVCFNGDNVDNFSPTIFPSGMLENPISPQTQTKAYLNRLLELDRKSKIGVLGHGNHNDWIGVAGYDYYQSFMADFQAPIFDEGGILNIVVGSQTYRMIMSHQHWGKSRINITNAPKRMIEYGGAGNVDIGWTAHTHQTSYEHFDKGGKELIAVVSGSYKRRDSWARKKGIGANPGMPGITLMLWPYHKHMEVFKDVEFAQDYMIASITEYELRYPNEE